MVIKTSIPTLIQLHVYQMILRPYSLYSNLKRVIYRGFQKLLFTYYRRGLRSFDFNLVQQNSTVVSSSKVDVGAFQKCTNLSSITNVPATIVGIGHSAFYNCVSLSSIALHEARAITRINESCFHGCKSLTTVSLPPLLQTVGQKAFYRCSSLKKLEIPASVTAIESDAFRNCTNLSSIIFVTNSSCIKLGDSAFYRCTALLSVHLPRFTRLIPHCTFYHCSSLTAINIPASIEFINESAFQHCTSLKVVNFEESQFSSSSSSSLKHIGNLAFSHCTSLITIQIPSSVSCIGYGAFSNCSSLCHVDIVGADTDIGPDAGSLSRLTELYKGTFHRCKSLRWITIPKSVKFIGAKVFSYCTSLSMVNLPDSVVEVGSEAFYECTSLVSVRFPGRGQVSSLTLSSSSSSSSLSSVTNLKIHKSAFDKCPNLASIAFPKNTVNATTNTSTNTNTNTSNNNIYCDFYHCSALEKRRRPGTTAAHRPYRWRHRHAHLTSMWLQRRFDHLPVHQFCYSYNRGQSRYDYGDGDVGDDENLEHLTENTSNTKSDRNVNTLKKIISKYPSSLSAIDAMGMTALHILCCNPFATAIMVKTLCEAWPGALSVKNVNGMTPYMIFLACRNLLTTMTSAASNATTHDDDSDNNNDDNNSSIDNNAMEKKEKEGQVLSLLYVLRQGIKCEDLSILFDAELVTELKKRNDTTGLFPFMEAATIQGCKVDTVYMLAMQNIDSFLSL